MKNTLAEVWQRRELLLMLVARDLKVRYRGSYLGFLWSLVAPLLHILIITVVFKYFVRMQVKDYSVVVLSAYIPWQAFQTTLMDACRSIVYHRDLVKKVYFPREVLPLASVGSNLVHFVLSYLILLLVLAVRGTPQHFTLWVGLIPGLIMVQSCFATGLALVLAAGNVFYHDVEYATGVATTIWFWLTPVVYLTRMVPERYRALYGLNPVVHLVDAYRQTILPDPGFAWSGLAYAIGVSLLIALAGFAIFRLLSWRLPEVL